MSVKEKIKSVLWAPVKAKLQERQIKSELREYRVLARRKGIVEADIHNRDFLKEALRQRLSSKGIQIQRKEKGALNIVYLSCMDFWERVNIPQALKKFGDLYIYNTDENGYRIREQVYPANWVQEREVLNEKIFQFVSGLHAEKKIDIVISYLSGYHLLSSTIEKIGQLGIATTAFWLDDKLKFRSDLDNGLYAGAASVCPSYDLNLTSATSSVIKYFVEGALAMFWPEGADADNFQTIKLDKKLYDVLFIGANYGSRGTYINYLKRNGIKVTAFGPGWEKGPIKSEDMSKVYAMAKINLGFGGIGYSMTSTCLKGRDFELPMSGNIYLTTYDEDLARVYDLEKHIYTYRSKSEMLDKIRFLLAHPDMCEQVRHEVRQYCVNNHTWEKRFQELFETFELI